MGKDKLAQGTSVVTGQGTTGTIESVIKHPVTAQPTAVVVTPAGMQPGTPDSIVTNPGTLRPAN